MATVIFLPTRELAERLLPHPISSMPLQLVSTSPWPVIIEDSLFAYRQPTPFQSAQSVPGCRACRRPAGTRPEGGQVAGPLRPDALQSSGQHEHLGQKTRPREGKEVASSGVQPPRGAVMSLAWSPALALAWAPRLLFMKIIMCARTLRGCRPRGW